MGYLLLAIASSALVSVFMRLSTGRVRANRSLLAVNYLVCAVLGAMYADFAVWTPRVAGFGTALWLGILTGGLYLLGFGLQQYNIRKNGVVLSSLFIKLGLLVPILFSLIVFQEIPSWLQVAGFVVAIGAIVVINSQKSDHPFSGGLLLLLVACGSCDLMSKVYEQFGPPALSDAFLFYTFAAALVLCLIWVLIKKERPGVRELFFGALIGIPNFFSAKFLLAALTRLPAVVVFPTFSVATLLAITLVGVAVFREKLTGRQWVALGMILLALVALNI